MTDMLVYLNGEFVEYEKAAIPVEDRGFLFADGIYEVVRVYGGQPFQMEPHLKRLEFSAAELELNLPFGIEEFDRLSRELLAKNGHTDATIYIQVTRGVAPRTHHFPPADTKPTVLILTRPIKHLPAEYRETGVSVITHPDIRWGRCNIKSVSLLPNVLAKEQAHRAGCFEAILVREKGEVSEGSSSNFFAVIDGVIRTHPKDRRILGGITREVVLQLCSKLGLPVKEEAFTLDELARAEEAFVSGTTTEVMPVTRIDGKPVGNGKPGPKALALYDAYRKLWSGN